MIIFTISLIFSLTGPLLAIAPTDAQHLNSLFDKGSSTKLPPAAHVSVLLPALISCAGDSKSTPVNYTTVNGCPIPRLPQSFNIDEQIVSWTDKFDLETTSGENFGTITEELISMTKSFELTAPDGKLIARARARLLSWGNQVDVTDCQGRAVGTIKEKVFESLFKVYTSYEILDPRGATLATSEKSEWITTEFYLTDSRGQNLATMKRGWFNPLSDRWSVTVNQVNTLDPRLLFMIAAYKTSTDNDRRSNSSGSDDNDNEKKSDD